VAAGPARYGRDIMVRVKVEEADHFYEEDEDRRRACCPTCQRKRTLREEPRSVQND
jgi:hypothetical protein